MRLDFEKIKSVTQGATYIDQQDGMVTFHRFNQEEEVLYSKTQFRDKVFSTAGVQMEFTTDGDCLCIGFETSPATSRKYFSMDIFVDGVVCKRIQNFEESALNVNYTEQIFPLGSFFEEISLKTGPKTVRIVFPWSVKTQLTHIEIKNATYVTPHKKNKVLVMYGDSITNGYDAVFTSDSYATRFADAIGAELFNKGIGGEIFFPALAVIKSHEAPDYITVAYGTNDWGTAEQGDFRKRCEAFFANLVSNYPTTAIFALTPIWRKNYKVKQQFGDFFDVEKGIREICSQYSNIKVLCGWDFIPHDEIYYADQRVHPNDQGFAWYFENLKKTFEKSIYKRKNI